MLLEIFCVTIHLKNTFTRTLHFEANTTTHRLATNPWLQFFLTVLSHQRDLQARRYRKHPSRQYDRLCRPHQDYHLDLALPLLPLNLGDRWSR